MGSKIRLVRKSIARVLTVMNQNQKENLRKLFKGKKYKPTDLDQGSSQEAQQDTGGSRDRQAGQENEEQPSPHIDLVAHGPGCQIKYTWFIKFSKCLTVSAL